MAHTTTNQRAELCRGDQGGVAAEFVMVAFVVLVLTFAVIETGLWMFYRHAAAAAAQDAAQAAADYGGGDAGGAAGALMAKWAPQVEISSIEVSGPDTNGKIRVRIRGHAPGIVDLLPLSIDVTGVAEVERFVPGGP
jgi:Flp pilus assembly protein TadG